MDMPSCKLILKLGQKTSELRCSSFWGTISSDAEWLCCARPPGNVPILQGTKSAWHPLLQSLPYQTDTPILWRDERRRELLRGSPVAEEARVRSATLDAEWDSIAEVMQKSTKDYPPGKPAQVIMKVSLWTSLPSNHSPCLYP